MKRKLLSALICVAMVASVLTGCGGSTDRILPLVEITVAEEEIKLYTQICVAMVASVLTGCGGNGNDQAASAPATEQEAAPFILFSSYLLNIYL